MNRYGVDVSYFEKELAALSRSLPNRTPAELERYLIRLAKVARPHKVKKRSKPKQALSIDQQIAYNEKLIDSAVMNLRRFGQS